MMITTEWGSIWPTIISHEVRYDNPTNPYPIVDCFLAITMTTDTQTIPTYIINYITKSWWLKLPKQQRIALASRKRMPSKRTKP